MSEAAADLLCVPALEADVVRLFTVEAALAADLQRQSVSGTWPAFLARCLGVPGIAGDYAVLIDLADLGEQGLEDYLVEGQGILPQSLFPDLAMLAGLKGFVLVVTSLAFGGAAVTLAPGSGLTPAGVWPREGAQPPALMLPAGPRPPVTPRQGGPRFGLMARGLMGVLLTLVCAALVIRYAL